MDRFRVAILGTSFGRAVQAAGFQRHPGFELVAIAGTDADKTRRIAAELGVPGAYDDWRRLLDEAKPDLVSIATDRKSTRLNSSHGKLSRMPSSA